ncbi:hypothetical protein U1872_06365 [Sphingomonas sp. RB3P16]|uniref:hypothetical protein n=1 Tax=Parasphingomonas frigoris TaxID=3096163 RepID=UPI002FCBEFBB
MSTSLRKPAAFFTALRGGKLLGPTLDQGEIDGCNEILSAAGARDWPLSWIAYALATAYHESAHTMEPVVEANWLSPAAAAKYFFRMYDIGGSRPAKARELGNIKPGDGALFCGRGYPQTTGRTNYTRADKVLGLGGSLVANPNRMLEPAIAAGSMIDAMTVGWYTGVSCRTFLPVVGSAGLIQFTKARAIVNGVDDAALIAGYAVDFQKALISGDWR